jgi:hypothetical protein
MFKGEQLSEIIKLNGRLLYNNDLPTLLNCTPLIPQKKNASIYQVPLHIANPMKHRRSWRANSRSVSEDISGFYEIWRFITLFIRDRHWSLSWAGWIKSKFLTTHSFEIHCLYKISKGDMIRALSKKLSADRVRDWIQWIQYQYAWITSLNSIRYIASNGGITVNDEFEMMR